MLDYKLIEALAMVAGEGGFEKAARQLHVTQSAVSQRIKLLEEQTGRVLLARANPPKATIAGQQLVRHYQQVKRLEDDLQDTWNPPSGKTFVTLPVGINGDSLATWFLDAVSEFVERESVLLDLRHDDQEQTHLLLKNGEVIGCVSVKDTPLQGCRMAFLGRMDYRMLATPTFKAKWFPDGLTSANACRAPLVIFNRRDNLHINFFERALTDPPSDFRLHYLPSSEKFVTVIQKGVVYGMLPDQQSSELMKSGQLVEIEPKCHVPVNLYWHCWNLKSKLLERFSSHLVTAARKLLPGQQ